MPCFSCPGREREREGSLPYDASVQVVCLLEFILLRDALFLQGNPSFDFEPFFIAACEGSPSPGFLFDLGPFTFRPFRVAVSFFVEPMPSCLDVVSDFSTSKACL